MTSTRWRRLVGILAGVIASLATSPAAAQNEPSRAEMVPIVRTERASGGLVRIVYNLTAAPESRFTVLVEASSDGGQRFLVRPATIRGDVGAGVTPGPGKTIEWDSARDTDDLQVERYVFRVYATPETSRSASSLRLVMIAGNDALNNLQRRTLTVPVVEVRDSGNLPVAGASVSFAVSTAAASFGAPDVRTFTVTTDANGRAAARTFTPLAAGAVDIDVKATFQNDTVTGVIHQTNIAEVAGPAPAAKPAPPGKAIQKSPGSGGGLSRKTLAILGGGGAGAVGVGLALSGGDGADGASSNGPPATRIFNGPVSGNLTLTLAVSPGAPECTRIESASGTLQFAVQAASNRTVSGTAVLRGNSSVNMEGFVTFVSCGGGPQLNDFRGQAGFSVPITGTTDAIRFSTTVSQISVDGLPIKWDYSFAGALSGDTLSGTLSMQYTQVSGGGPWSSAVTAKEVK